MRGIKKKNNKKYGMNEIQQANDRKGKIGGQWEKLGKPRRRRGK